MFAMKNFYTFLGLILLTLLPVGCVHSPVAETTHSTKPPKRIAWHDELYAKEKEVWDAYKLKDKATLNALLADDYYAIEDADGEIMTKAEALQDVAGLEIKTYEMTELSIVEVSEGVAIVRYKVRMRGSADHHEFIPHWSRVSSLWRKRAGRWQNVMYQETKIGE